MGYKTTARTVSIDRHGVESDVNVMQSSRGHAEGTDQGGPSAYVSVHQMRGNLICATFSQHHSTTTMIGIKEALAECDSVLSSDKIPWQKIANTVPVRVVRFSRNAHQKPHTGRPKMKL